MIKMDALVVAIVNDDYKGIKELIDDGYNINEKYYYHGNHMTPLGIAIQSRKPEMVRFLLEFGADINTKVLLFSNMGPIFLACNYGFDDILMILFEYDANINNDKDQYGKNPLHMAVYNNHSECVRILLTKNHPLNEKTRTGWTALHYASLSGYMTCIQLLLDAGANFIVKTNDGESIMDFANTNVKEYIQNWIQNNEYPVKGALDE